MTAYMDLNGVPASGNRWLFTEVLRDVFGFDGFVVSDANAVRNLLTHGFASDLADAGVRAVVAPGGSLRDDEVIAAAREAGVTLYFTGTRHFAH